MDDVAVDRNDADVTISLLIIINNVIHSVINTSSLIIRHIKISTISSIKSTIRMIINLTRTRARHAAPDTEQHRHTKKNKTQTRRKRITKKMAPLCKAPCLPYLPFPPLSQIPCKYHTIQHHLQRLRLHQLALTPTHTHHRSTGGGREQRRWSIYVPVSHSEGGAPPYGW